MVVAHSHDFRPGHPVIFWLFIVVLIFALYSGAQALYDVHGCDQVAGGAKHWRVFPPEWICGSGSVEVTR